MTKPDGGRGWLEFFLAQGLTVYVPDLPFHGRSASVATPGANAVALRTDVIESHFTATARVDNPDWLSAKAHCQWPGASDASFLSLSLSVCVCVCVSFVLSFSLPFHHIPAMRMLADFCLFGYRLGCAVPPSSNNTCASSCLSC